MFPFFPLPVRPLIWKRSRRFCSWSRRSWRRSQIKWERSSRSETTLKLGIKKKILQQIAIRMTFNSKRGKHSRVLCALRQFLQRHCRAQLKRRAQQVQDELVSHTSLFYYAVKPACFLTLKFLCIHQEFDHNILERLLSEEEEDDSRTATEQTERAVADAAWMKRVIEEQLQLEQEREIEFDTLRRWALTFGCTKHVGDSSTMKPHTFHPLPERRLSGCGRNDRHSGRKRPKPESSSCTRRANHRSKCNN